MLKPYGAAAAISATVPAGPITGLLTMKITPQGDVVAYAQELVDGVLDANEGEVTIVEGVNTVVLAGEDFLLGVGSLATLTSQLEAEGRFVQELIVVEEAA
jgi:hypothetical protein